MQSAAARRGLATLTAVAAAAAVGVAAPAPARAATVPTSFSLSGAGFGHGIGMSQYGAYAQALGGRSADTILKTYYPGTVVAQKPDTQDIKVGLGSALSSVPLAVCPVPTQTPGTVGMTFTLGSTTTQPVAPGTVVTVKATAATSSGTTVTVTAGGTTLLTGPVTATSGLVVTWTGTRYLAGPAAVAVRTSTVPTCSNLSSSTAPASYRDGRLLLFADAKSTAAAPRVALVNQLRLGDEYLRGIAEMPSSWGKGGIAALEAQAVTARGYALKKLATLRADCRCHVLPTTADQVFVGWKKAADVNYGKYWLAAVDATRNADAGTGAVVTYGGAVATTTFYSSSGGRTENVSEVWGSAQSSFPYLESVDDPWSKSSVNPYRSWSRSITQAAMAKAFALPDVVRVDLTARTTGGSVAKAVAVSSSGQTAALTGQRMRSALGLPSAWVGLVMPKREVTRWSGTDRYATAVAVSKAIAPAQAPAVVVVNGSDAHLVDGLVAGPLAKVAGGPVLLVDAGSVPAVTMTEVARLAPHTVYVIGGEDTVGKPVADALGAIASHPTVTRLAGVDRYATAAAVAGQIVALRGARPDVVVASGRQANLVDALAVGGPAGALARPVLLVAPHDVPSATSAALKATGAQHTVLVGGSDVVDDQVEAALPGAVRVAGADRYATSVAVADAFGVVASDAVALSSGEQAHLVDALAAGATGRITLLTQQASLPSSVSRWFGSATAVTAVGVLGGTDTVSSAVAAAVTG